MTHGNSRTSITPRRERLPARPGDTYEPMLDKDRVADELRTAIDRLREQRSTNDDRAKRAALREDEADRRYWQAQSDGISAGLAAMRDVLFNLTGQDN